MSTPNKFTIQFEPHNFCNLNCIHCYHEHTKNKSILSIKGVSELFKEFDRLISTFSPKPKVIFRISGGEPLIHNDTFLTLLYSNHLYNYDTTLITNATLIDRSIIEKLYLCNLNSVQVSFDSPVKEIYEYIRGKNTFDRALQGIKYLSLLTNYIQITTTLLKGINDKDFEQLFQFCLDNKILAVNINRFFPQGNSKELLEFTYSPYEFKNILEDIIQTATKYYPLIVIIKDPLVKVFFKDLPPNIVSDVCCYIGKNFLAIGYDGTVFACRKLALKIGDMKKNSLVDIWYKSKILKQLINRDKYLNSDCKGCKNLLLCKGGCVASSYNINKIKFEKDLCCWL